MNETTVNGLLAEAMLEIAATARSGGDVLAVVAEAARRVTGARAALCSSADGAEHAVGMSGAPDAVMNDPRPLAAFAALGNVVERVLTLGNGATGMLAVLEPVDDSALEVLAAHAELALVHGRLAREASSTRSIYRTLVEQLPAVTYYRAFDRVGTPSYASPQVEALLGFSPDELAHDESLWRKRIHPDDIVRVQSGQAAYRPELTEQPIRAEYRMIHRSGRVVWVENYAHAVRDEAGQPRFVLGLMFDVTERKQLEEQLLQAQKMEAIGKLAGGLAHDFNNLLSVILSYGLSLSNDLVDEERRQEAKEIVRAGERARTLTQQLLAFSSKQMLAPKVLDLGALATQLRAFFKRLLGEDIELVFELAHQRSHVKADPTQIEQILVNLAVNARDAMPQGGVLTLTVEDVVIDDAFVRRHPGLSPGCHVRVSMRDTGIGMDEATASHVFEPFFTTKDHSRNSGLGLSTALGIASQSGGTITVTSTPGEGSTFVLLLPTTDDAEQTPRPPAANPLPRGNETVLLAEDDEQVRRLVNTLLERLGYRVLACETGDAALETAAKLEEPIALLLTDIVMPRMSGFELARRMATLRPDTRILFMSGYNEEAVSRHGAPNGVTIMTKPFSVGELARKLRAVLDATGP